MSIINVCINSESYLIPATQIPQLVYYSHSLLIVLCIAATIFIYKRNSVLNLSIVSLLVSIISWLSLSLLNWVSNLPQLTLLTWTLILLSEIAIYLLSTNLILFYNNIRMWSSRITLTVVLILTPLIFLLPTKYTIIGFNLNNCSAIEGPMAIYYTYAIEFMCILFSLYTTATNQFGTKPKIGSKLIPFGTILFLIIFTAGNIYGSLTGDWAMGDVGLIGIPMLIIFIIYSIFKYRIPSTNVNDKKILLIINWILIGSLITVGELGLLYFIIPLTLLVVISLSILVFTIDSRESNHLAQISSLASSLKDLNDSLESKVAEQTATIKKSYEIEQNAHRELVKLSDAKDNFISLSQHNLRIPITSIENNIEALLARSEELDNNTRASLINAKESISNLNEIANEFKNISKIRRGSQFLLPTKETILPILISITSELKYEIERMNISISYPTGSVSWPVLNIDRNKIKDALMVIVENAVKYNIYNGYIKILSRVDENHFVLTIENSGLGLSNEDAINLNKSNFYRSERVKEVNSTGMGIGLYLAKSVIEAHHGKLTISSDGENLGAMVEILLPIDFLKSR